MAEIELKEKEIVYGIVYITDKQHPELKGFFPTKRDGLSVLCDNEPKKINSGGNYISGLKKNNIRHKAFIGTKIQLLKDKRGYKLEYVPFDSNDNIESAIQAAKSMLLSYMWSFSNNETNVRCELVDPILSALGWRFQDSLMREVYMGKDHGKADYVLFGENNNPCLIIETKPQADDLRGENLNTQLKKYWKSNRFPNLEEVPVLVTNGQEWQLRVYQELKPIAKTDLFEDNQFGKFIKAFSKEQFFPDSVRGIGVSKEYSKNRKDTPFSIRIKDSFVEGTNTAEVFMNFVDMNRDEIKEYERNGCFDKKIFVGEDNNRAKGKKGSDGLYITRDYSTYAKRMIINQIIYMLDKVDEIELIDKYDHT